ncbi:hypothetical protein CROQUDRAFT_652814 [Cronartium quercuum f. sp. fusiforme G11]|uniref:Uncharacterized protein n=1 Tax=Cronartium quercuum f. sp. fusiforme G11 TaxID=708437 RepID=A0A9P6NR36_9BASI|nr:hypothetical protein CROQUDRAFT_652814 [Cronartium quercuum f. sp. fusiforme G11]
MNMSLQLVGGFGYVIEFNLSKITSPKLNLQVPQTEGKSPALNKQHVAARISLEVVLVIHRHYQFCNSVRSCLPQSFVRG